VQMHQPAAAASGSGSSGGLQQPYNVQAMEAAELAAFEKGRMAGEMEAIRRAEREAPQKLKSMEGMVGAPGADVDVLAQQALANRPDVLEINRLTWVQKIAAVLGESTAIAYLVLTIVWLHEYRGNVAWNNDSESGDMQFFNTGLLTMALGLFFQSQAVGLYRFLPLNTSPLINKALYIFNQAAALTCWLITLSVFIMSTPGSNAAEVRFWRVDSWCFILALAIYIPHALYSMVRTVLSAVWPVDFETWAEVNNNLDQGHVSGWGLIQSRRSNSAIPANGLEAERDRRTIYTAAPMPLSRGSNLPAANANVGAMVPVAPANAPRWAENPRTHSEDYFLLARAKWANVALWAMGGSMLMVVSAQEALQAAGRQNWAQGDPVQNTVGMNEAGTEAKVIGALGLMVLASLCFITYSAMPPRTTLVKNGIINEVRRSSISHTAETRLGHNIV
jgi:hypothetical protein